MKLKNGDLVDTMLLWKNEFINYEVALNKSKNTISTYNDRLNGFIEFCHTINDDRNIDTLKQMDIIKFFSWLDSITIKKATTKQSYLQVLKVFFNFISKNNDDLYLFDFLFDNFKIKVTNSKKLQNNYMNDKERKNILTFINYNLKKQPNFKNFRNSLLIKLLMLAGLRISEALNLKLSDFQLNAEFYEISILGKGGNFQSAFIDKSVIEKEINYFDRNFDLNNFIFISKINDKFPFSRNYAYLVLKRIYAKCGIFNKTGCHILRHSFAMNLLEHNVNIGVIQKALRHKKIQTTMIYADANDEMVKKAVKVIS